MASTPEVLERYRRVLMLFLRHPPGRLLARDGDPKTEVPEDEREAAEDFVGELESMGPCFVKLGQLLAGRPDLLAPAFIEALDRLTDDVEPFPGAEARSIIEQELGVDVDQAFQSFEERPLASASLGQVHRAVSRSGRLLVVKIQRPGVRDRVLTDLEALENIAEGLEALSDTARGYALRSVLREFRRSMLRELDYRQEARNMVRMRSALERFDDLVAPEPLTSLCSERVLTMERLEGARLDELSPVVLLELDREQLARSVSRAYLQQILVDGFFHADPHPGNVLLTVDHKIGFLDLGMVGYLDPRVRGVLVKLLLALGEGRGHEVADLTAQLGNPTEDFDIRSFRHEVGELVAEHADSTLERIQTGALLLEVARLGVQCGLRPAPAFPLLGRTLSHLDGLLRSLDPDLDAQQLMADEAARILAKRLREGLAPRQVLRTLLETNELVQGMPRHANRILADMAEGRFEIPVRSFDERALLQGFQRVANRIATGLVLAALIIGAALTMSVPTTWTIGGYPGLSILLFVAAALGGGALVISILLRDTPPPDNAKSGD